MNNNRMLLRVYVLLLCAISAGCATTHCPTLPGDVGYCLRSPASGPTFSALQRVVTGQGEQRETLLVQVENRSDQLVLVALSPMGQTLLNLSWDGQHLVADGPPFATPSVSPAVLLAMLQFALWSPEQIRLGLSDDVLWQEDSGGARLMRDGELLLRMQRSGQAPSYDSLDIALPPSGLVLNFRTLQDAGCCPDGAVP